MLGPDKKNKIFFKNYTYEDGFLGIEFAREEIGITVSYWRDLEAIKNWRENAEHTMAREKGRKDWYKAFKTRISKVERDYGFEKS